MPELLASPERCVHSQLEIPALHTVIGNGINCPERINKVL